MRKLENWLTSYLTYTENTESTQLFNRWVGISTVASALKKKVWLELGRLKVFANMYIVLVAEPGVARKSQSISYATELLDQVPGIYTSADSITAQALIQDLEDSTTYDMLNDRMYRHSSLSVIAKEFETFLGAGGQRMMVILTDLFDSGESPWKYRTKGLGTSIIPSVYLNILGATTPHSLTNCMSDIAIGGGLTSRILFVYSEKREKRVAYPSWDDELAVTKQNLIDDLIRISELKGRFSFATEAREYWNDWYNAYDETPSKRIESRSEFSGWYSRKPLQIQKVSMVLSACRGNSMTVESCDIINAVTFVEELEHGMGKIYGKRAEIESPAIDMLYHYVKEYKAIAEKHLMHLVWRDMDEEEFDARMNVLLYKGLVERKFKSPIGETAIWYHLKEK